MSAEFESKHVHYWPREFTGLSLAGGFRWRNVFIFRQITWVNPSKGFVREMLRRFQHSKELSYSAKNRCLYLYTQHRVLKYRRDIVSGPCRTENTKHRQRLIVGPEYLASVRILGRPLSGKPQKHRMSKSLLPRERFSDSDQTIRGGNND